MPNPEVTTGGVGASQDRLWHRERWMEAVWCSDLKPLERLVAAVYADHAHDKRTTWVTLARLSERSGLAESTCKVALKGLTSAGFLLVVEKARQHRSAVYGMVIPTALRGAPPAPLAEARQPGPGPLRQPGDGPLANPDSRETSPDSRETSSRQPGDGPNLSTYLSTKPLSSSEAYATELTGLDGDDERISFIEQLLSGQVETIRKPRVWLRALHSNGDLLPALDDLQAKAKAKAERAERTERPQPAAWASCPGCGSHVQTGRHDDGCEMIPCDECAGTGRHYRGCSKRVIRLCAGGCGEEVSGAAAATGRPCRVCHTVTAMDGSRSVAVTA